MTDAKKITTTDNGAPAASDEHSQSVGADGPGLPCGPDWSTVGP